MCSKYDCGEPVLSVSDPALIKQILVKEFHVFHNRFNRVIKVIDAKGLVNARDGDWKRIRLIASPAFTSSKLKRMYPLIDECCGDFLAALDRHVSASGRTKVDFKRVTGAYGLDVIARTAFATKCNPYSCDTSDPFVMKAELISGYETPHIWRDILPMILPTFVINNRLWKWLATIGSGGGGGAMDPKFFNNVIKHLISERKESVDKHNDFLQLLIDVEREDNTNTTTTTGADSVATDASEGHHVNEGVDELMAEKRALSGVVEKRLTTDEIVAQCDIFFMAGYETTASTLSYCTYELALNPDIQDRLVAETRAAFNETTGDIDYDTLCRLPLLDAVISETLRKYPPVIEISREASKDVVLSAGSGGPTVMIEKGMMAHIPVYAIHHSPDNYPDPEAFKPDRFLPHNRSQIKPYTYLPFGSGPRNCVAMRFALLESKLALVKMIQQFRFYRVPNTEVPIRFRKRRLLLQAESVVVGVVQR
ncbi:unnamed protein product [Medioppia subpectinata]|uniref:Cytochrome P450 n=1 Tax=Medioppia subpectinata TaxID=1979941 RepID=A0A7R9PVC0_9ACAR|nr:unnamed protein product [Medioppia subpectinata]CAG2102112.1 unnamed protein product [Medioppia subpectinata]